MRQYIVDAFTDKPFAGNPAAVCVMDAPLPDSFMQMLAVENNFSETAFLLRGRRSISAATRRWPHRS